MRPVPVRSETIQVSGIRCERCVMRLGGALRGLDGIESANASLMGRLSLSWDDERVEWDAILAALAGAGFRPVGTTAAGPGPPGTA
jgi:copper chaperone CopZ